MPGWLRSGKKRVSRNSAEGEISETSTPRQNFSTTVRTFERAFARLRRKRQGRADKTFRDRFSKDCGDSTASDETEIEVASEARAEQSGSRVEERQKELLSALDDQQQTIEEILSLRSSAKGDSDLISEARGGETSNPPPPPSRVSSFLAPSVLGDKRKTRVFSYDTLPDLNPSGGAIRKIRSVENHAQNLAQSNPNIANTRWAFEERKADERVSGVPWDRQSNSDFLNGKSSSNFGHFDEKSALKSAEKQNQQNFERAQNSPFDDVLNLLKAAEKPDPQLSIFVDSNVK